MFLAKGNTLIYFGIIDKPANFPFGRKMTDRTSGTVYLPVLHDFFFISEFSGNKLVISGIGNINLIFFLFGTLFTAFLVVCSDSIFCVFKGSAAGIMPP